MVQAMKCLNWQYVFIDDSAVFKMLYKIESEKTNIETLDAQSHTECIMSYSNGNNAVSAKS